MFDGRPRVGGQRLVQLSAPAQDPALPPLVAAQRYDQFPLWKVSSIGIAGLCQSPSRGNANPVRQRWVWGRRVYVVATRLADGELLILDTNHAPQTALADYRLRWGIETLFAALKTRGFNLESTHFRHAERLSKLVALIALGFCWACSPDSGTISQHRPIAIKSHGRRAKSLFRYGCDFLRRTCCDLALWSAEFDQVIELLSPY
jgi:hypothetical protein